MKLKRSSRSAGLFILLSSFCFTQEIKEDQFLIARTVSAIWQHVDAEKNGKIEYKLFSRGDIRICRVRLKGIELFLLSRSSKRPFLLATPTNVIEKDGYLFVNDEQYKQVGNWSGSQPIYE